MMMLVVTRSSFRTVAKRYFIGHASIITLTTTPSFFPDRRRDRRNIIRGALILRPLTKSSLTKAAYCYRRLPSISTSDHGERLFIQWWLPSSFVLGCSRPNHLRIMYFPGISGIITACATTRSAPESTHTGAVEEEFRVEY